MKKMVRARIAEKTSSIGVAFRTGDEARLKWKGLKKEVTEKDNDCSATGGGRPKTRIIPFEDLVMAVIGEKSSLHNGIDGGLQTVDCGGYKVTHVPVTSVSGKGPGTGTRGAKTMLLSVPHEMQQGPAIIELPEQVYTSQGLPVQPSTSSSNMAVVPESQPPSTNPVVTPVRSRGWKAWLMKRRREASGSKQSRGETAIEDEEESCVFKEVGDRGHQPVSLHVRAVAQDETAKWLVVALTLLEKFTFPQDLGIVDTPWRTRLHGLDIVGVRFPLRSRSWVSRCGFVEGRAPVQTASHCSPDPGLPDLPVYVVDGMAHTHILPTVTKYKRSSDFYSTHYFFSDSYPAQFSPCVPGEISGVTINTNTLYACRYTVCACSVTVIPYKETILAVSKCAACHKSNTSKCTAHNISIAPKCTAHNVSIAPKCTAHNISIAPKSTAYNVSIASKSTAYNVSIAPKSTAYNISIAPKSTAYNISIAPKCTAYNVSIAPKSTAYNISIDPKCTSYITYPLPQNAQPITYPSPANVQPTTYPSSPNLQPTTYPSPQNLQRKTYPSPQNLQPTTHTTPQKLQTTIFLALKTSQQTFTRETMTPHHMYLTTVASFSDDLNSTTGPHDLVLWGGCKVPVYQPYGPDVKQFIKKLPPHNCSRQPPLIKVERDVLTLNTALLEKRKEILSNCTYEVINRVSEGQINYSKPVVFNSSVRLQADFIRVRCHTRSENSKEELVHTELHPILTKKQDVEDKLQSRMEHFLNLTTKNSGTRSQPLSIVMVGVDSVSRLNMIRHLTSTRHFLLTQLQAIDLINYNKVGQNTFPNLLPMMSGKAMTDFNRSDFSNHHMDTLGISFLWDELKSAGYRTLFAEDWPGAAIFNESRRCFGTQPNDELVLNYTLAFQRLFRDKPHFGLTFLTRSSHDDVNDPSQVDGYHTRYLTSLVQEGLVKNTLFVFFSDHGMRFGGVNAARLVTPFDIHATLLDVLYRVPGVRRNSTSGVQDPGISLFDEIPANRTCIDAGIPLLHCVCVNTRELTASSSAAKKAGTALIATLNAAVTKANVTDKCHRLQLSSINKAVELRGAQQYLRKQCPSVRNYAVEGSVYRMTVVARPGDGKFEALMSRCNGTSDFVIYGDLDRINKPRIAAVVSLVCVTVACVVWVENTVSQFFSFNIQPHLRQRGSFKTDTRSGCKIPTYRPFGPDVVESIKVLSPHPCKRRPKLTFVVGDTLVLNTTLLEERNETVTCCYYEAINRVTENEIKYSERVEFNASVRLSAQFVRVRCHTKSGDNETKYTEFHSIIGKKRGLEDLLQARTRQFLQNRTSALLMNVVMIGVDSVSRLNMIRHLKRTRHFLLDRMQALDLEDYNKVGLNTFPNILPMMTGHAMKEFNRSVLKTQHLDTLHLGFLWEEFKNAGYRTLYAEDLPEISIFNYLKEGFKRPPAHYYNRPLEKAKEKNEELFGDWRHCFGTQPQDELILNYSLAFQRVFRDKPHFAFTFLTASTHEDVNGASQVDGYHARYLSSLVEEGLVNNTLLIFFSDHGIRWGPVRNTPQGGFEDSRPFMYLAFPSRFREEHPELMQRVQKNAARLVTPFDIHATLLDVLYRVPGVYRQKSSAENKGISLFDEISPERTCADAGIPLPFCVCVETHPLNTSSPTGQQAGAALVASLNAAMTQANVTGKCHMLQLGKVTNLQQIGGAEHYMKKKCERVSSTDVEVFRVRITTKPRAAQFEAFMFRCEVTGWKLTVHGEVDRLNEYGDSSYCVDE
ncbi:hypothetical protein BaRGS_00022603, partial [Batillaria attramentaria]